MALSPRMLTALADALESLADLETDENEDGALDAMEGAEEVIYEQKQDWSPLDHERRIVEAVLELLENRIH